MTTKLLDRLNPRRQPKAPKIAHIRDWAAYEASGEIKGLCGKKLKGVPPPKGHEACVVCLALAHNQRWSVR
jgi:hypothetical protein